MPYAVEFAIYLLACCLVTIILASLLLPLGEVFNIAFAAGCSRSCDRFRSLVVWAKKSPTPPATLDP